ncbi:hypothetical protein BJV78DRAFT_1152772 [Lactifluus subvellereus]|nr:hypothetical protein BJV78DRAFT_1152772 [Lactifluus subvellereus]
MPNSLTRRVSLTAGPLFFETLVKHYFARVVRDSSKTGVPLRKEELLYDEAFNINFLDASTRHTVEELQSFSNVRTPSPPWVHVVRLVIPMSSCDEAAVHLIQAFGGEESMKRVVGGTKWWQVRGIRGLDAEWISAKKDWQDARRRAKERNCPISTRRKHPNEGLGLRNASSEEAELSPLPASEGEERHNPPLAPNGREPARDSATYQPEMDEMRCILYSHGGGYYFGSVDQERYSIQRYARKIHGRILGQFKSIRTWSVLVLIVFVAVNYRLAPQYPFPCAIQDLLAACAAHRPIGPERIVIAGDSAGGGLSLALLQVIRDSGLPAPAGGVLISPCIFTNTDTDVIPITGLSLHKPSPLWPPPPNEISNKVHSGLRKSFTDVLYRRSKGVSSRVSQAVHLMDSDSVIPKALPTERGPMNVESIVSQPLPGVPDADQSVLLQTAEGKTIEVAQQIQLYAPNGLLKHPLVSPAFSYLGGLPPLLFIAGEREVLRDEIIYTAHRAAYPERFPVPKETRKMYPPFKHIETRMRSTPVHLQVYDDAAHVLPILFPFTTPGKYCYRAMALFFKHVTNTLQSPLSPTALLTSVIPTADYAFSTSPVSLTPCSEVPKLQVPHPKPRRSLTSGISRAASNLRRRGSMRSRPLVQNAGRLAATVGDISASTSGHVTPRSQDLSDESVDDAGPIVGRTSEPHARSAHRNMIRERVSTHGIIRPLEPESELPAMQVAPEFIGTLSERAIQRYVTGKERIDKKFAHAIKRIEKQRLRNIDPLPRRESKAAASGGEGEGADATTEDALSAPPSWNMAWALDEDERPPPSSIVARRDTVEALKLARVADEAVLASERMLSGNNLWSVVVGFLTATPDGCRKEREMRPNHRPKAKGKVHVVGHRTRLGSLLGRKRPSGSRSSSGDESSAIG